MSALPPLGHYRTLTPDERARARDELNENIDSVALLGLLEIHLADGEGDEELARDLIDEFDEAGETVLAARARIALWEHPTITDTSLL